MNTHLHVSYLGLVRNVIGRSEEALDVLAGTTVGQLLRLLIEEHGPPLQQSVLKQNGELRAMAQLCVDDRDIDELNGFDTRLGEGEQVSIVVGVYPPEGG
jgi:molybdopterin converting factor small subunit